jgi:hypothetical protein
MTDSSPFLHLRMENDGRMQPKVDRSNDLHI